MKAKMMTSLSLAVAIGTTAYLPTATAGWFNHRTTVPVENAQQIKNDGVVVANLLAFHENQLKLAREAVERSTDRSVKHYAKMYERRHQEFLDLTLKVSKNQGIAPVRTKSSAQLVHKGNKELKKLSALNGPSFDKVFLQDMIKDHSMEIKLINNKLLKETTNPELKELIVKMQPHIERHLQEAEMLQKELHPVMHNQQASH